MAKDEEVEWRRMRRLNGEGFQFTVVARRHVKLVIDC